MNIIDKSPGDTLYAKLLDAVGIKQMIQTSNMLPRMQQYIYTLIVNNMHCQPWLQSPVSLYIITLKAWSVLASTSTMQLSQEIHSSPQNILLYQGHTVPLSSNKNFLYLI
jgi:hypothetical protein